MYQRTIVQRFLVDGVQREVIDTGLQVGFVTLQETSKMFVKDIVTCLIEKSAALLSIASYYCTAHDYFDNPMIPIPKKRSKWGSGSQYMSLMSSSVSFSKDRGSRTLLVSSNGTISMNGAKMESARTKGPRTV